jgi:hypothetical protein
MTTRRAFLALGLGAAFAPLVTARAAWARDWVDLGSRKVSVYGDADRIMVADNGGLYSKLRIKVAGNGVHVERAVVHFGNGDEVAYDIDVFVQKNTVSGSVDLPGDGRAILYVDMFYRRPKNGKGAAVVTHQGLTA